MTANRLPSIADSVLTIARGVEHFGPRIRDFLEWAFTLPVMNRWLRANAYLATGVAIGATNYATPDQWAQITLFWGVATFAWAMVLWLHREIKREQRELEYNRARAAELLALARREVEIQHELDVLNGETDTGTGTAMRN